MHCLIWSIQWCTKLWFQWNLRLYIHSACNMNVFDQIKVGLTKVKSIFSCHDHGIVSQLVCFFWMVVSQMVLPYYFNVWWNSICDDDGLFHADYWCCLRLGNCWMFGPNSIQNDWNRSVSYAQSSFFLSQISVDAGYTIISDLTKSQVFNFKSSNNLVLSS